MIKIKDAENGEFFYTYQGLNNEVLVVSETFTSKQNALKGATAIHTVIGNEWLNAANEAISKSRKKILTVKDVLKILGKVKVEPEIKDETIRKNNDESENYWDANK